MNTVAKLYLIPNLISDINIENAIPQLVSQKVNDIKHYIVENIRESRRYLKKLNPEIKIDELQFYELNKHTSDSDILNYLDECKNGNDMGLISDAGLPCIADPGNIIVMFVNGDSY